MGTKEKWSDSDIDEIVNSYIETALWSSNDIDDDEPMDKEYTIHDIDEAGRECAERDVKAFLLKADQLTPDTMYYLCMEVGRIGHDFWLTRNGHGAGFWDGDYDKDDVEMGKYLTDIAKSFGEMNALAGGPKDFTLY